MEGPDVEGHFLEQALHHDVMGVVVRIDKARDNELAGRVDDFDILLHRDCGAIRSIRLPRMSRSATTG